jgi:hypothetical protein
MSELSYFKTISFTLTSGNIEKRQRICVVNSTERLVML